MQGALMGGHSGSENARLSLAWSRGKEAQRNNNGWSDLGNHGGVDR